MKTNIKDILQQLLRSPREFPVEAAMGMGFFCISAWHTAYAHWDETVAESISGVNADILMLFVPLVVLTFWLHHLNRWAYVASGLLFLPLMALDLKPFLFTYGFGFTYVLAGILLLVGVRRMNNRRFASHALHVATQLFFGLVISVLLSLAVMAIVSSYCYIFSIDMPKHLIEYILEFIWFVVAPQVCCTLISQGENDDQPLAKVLRLILNYILTPAVVIYTVILYVYFIKIAITWDLPKGGVAWMGMGFVTATLAGKLMQYVLDKQHFEWFYRHFTWIAIPPLIMYWVGSIYRIRLYSLTESRCYLLVAGILMTLFVFMLLWRRTRWFQLMALVFGAAIILFTYIPGISAKHIGFACQKARLEQYIHELKLLDAKTGKFVKQLDLDKIRRDSVTSGKYQEVCSIIEYVRQDMGRDAFVEKYGQWSWYDNHFKADANDHLFMKTLEKAYTRVRPVDVGEYSILLPPDHYSIDEQNGTATVKHGDKVVLVYPFNERLSAHPQLLEQPDSLFAWHNDSLLLVIKEYYVYTDGTAEPLTYDYLLFRKEH